MINMAKRFTDTNKWEDGWYTDLNIEMKMFYNYILDKCDHAGVWKVNFKLANFLIGKKINKKDVINAMGNRIYIISDEYWFIKNFIDFQYGELNEKNNAHKGVFKILNKFNILDYKSLGASEGLVSPKGGAQDKDKDKDKDKEKEKENFDIDFIYKNYPRKQGKKSGVEKLQSIIKTQEQYDNVMHGVIRYRKYCEQNDQEQKYIKQFSTWVNGEHWNDDYVIEKTYEEKMRDIDNEFIERMNKY